MKTVYLVRHGETVCNRSRVVQDANDELTESGRRQAAILAERASTLAFEHLLVSDYVRTRQTVEPLLTKTELAPEYSALFREVRRPSTFFGSSNETEEYHQFIKDWSEHLEDPLWHHSDEENFQDLCQRALEASNRLLELPGNVLVVSHGMFIRFLMLYLVFGTHLTPDLWRTVQYSLLTSNTGITALRYNEEHKKWYLLTFNDFAHFAE